MDHARPEGTRAPAAGARSRGNRHSRNAASTSLKRRLWDLLRGRARAKYSRERGRDQEAGAVLVSRVENLVTPCVSSRVSSHSAIVAAIAAFRDWLSLGMW